LLTVFGLSFCLVVRKAYVAGTQRLDDVVAWLTLLVKKGVSDICRNRKSQFEGATRPPLNVLAQPLITRTTLPSQRRPPNSHFQRDLQRR
jgi:hypothetical protein